MGDTLFDVVDLPPMPGDVPCCPRCGQVASDQRHGLWRCHPCDATYVARPLRRAT